MSEFLFLKIPSKNVADFCYFPLKIHNLNQLIESIETLSDLNLYHSWLSF